MDLIQCQLTFILEPLNPNVAAEGWGYFCFYTPMPAPVWDSICLCVYEELHLMVHMHPILPIKAK
jgi:hypothetical protein